MLLSSPVQEVGALSVQPDGRAPIRCLLPEEIPVAMVYDGTSHAVMMASPDDIHDLALGFSLTEGIIDAPSRITEFEIVAHDKGIEARMWLADDCGQALLRRRRATFGPVGCGLCGIDSLEEAVREIPDRRHVPLQITAAEIIAAGGQLRSRQKLHDQTRAVHGAGFLIPGQGILLIREDVGRHNALDKLVGALAREEISPATGAIVLTSRVSVEMVQKTAMAGAGILIAASAPTAHAVRLAERAGLTIAALARSGGFELFTHPWRMICEVRTDVA